MEILSILKSCSSTSLKRISELGLNQIRNISIEEYFLQMDMIALRSAKVVTEEIIQEAIRFEVIECLIYFNLKKLNHLNLGNDKTI